jgi:hypothetical protein
VIGRGTKKYGNWVVEGQVSKDNRKCRRKSKLGFKKFWKSKSAHQEIRIQIFIMFMEKHSDQDRK